jgi:hypothetical protein
MPDTPPTLSALEVLDAAGAEVPVDRIEATGVILWARGVLHSADRLRVVHAVPGEHATSDDLLRGLLDAADSGLVQRYRGAYRLTAIGRATLDEFGSRASAGARAAAADIAQMEASALRVEADRTAGT